MGSAKHIVIDDPAARRVDQRTFRPCSSDALAVLTATLSERFNACGLLLKATFLDRRVRLDNRFRQVATSIRARWLKVIGSNERAAGANSLRGVAMYRYSDAPSRFNANQSLRKLSI